MNVLPILAAVLFAIVPPTPNHYVTDSQGALSSATHARLEQRLRRYEEKTGNQIIVYIGDTTGGVPLEEWTAQAADAWKIGHAKHDNGAVLFLFMRDHRVRIEVGYGLESVLTDAVTKRIIDTRIVPQMKAGNVDGAVENGISAMLGAASPGYVDGSPGPSAAPFSSDLPDWAAVLIILTLFGLFIVLPVTIIAIIVSRKRRGGFGKAFHDMWFWNPGGGSGAFFGGYSGGGGGGFGGDGGGFSAGGGSFGGGGASGSW